MNNISPQLKLYIEKCYKIKIIKNTTKLLKSPSKFSIDKDYPFKHIHQMEGYIKGLEDFIRLLDK